MGHSAVELRTLAAAPIAAAIVATLSPSERGTTKLKEVAEWAVALAKALEEAASASMKI
jgi:hypothetical protein